MEPRTFAMISLALFLVQACAKSTCPDFFPGNINDPNVESIEMVRDRERKFLPPGDIGNHWKSRIRIVGGSRTDLNSDLPHYIVSVDNACTGTILNNKWILTAAHCLTSTNSTIYFFNSERKRWDIKIGVARSVPHPDYDEETNENDILVAELENEVPDDARFVTINRRRSIPREFSMTRAAGFGVVRYSLGYSDGLLRQVDVPYRSNKQCNKLHSQYKQKEMMCAAYSCGGCDSCLGDSGGPLFQYTNVGELYQVGVTSFGSNCGRHRSPGYYARVSTYYKWIRQIMRPYGFFVGGTIPQIEVRSDSCPQKSAVRMFQLK